MQPTHPPAAEPERQPSYRDRELFILMKTLRASVRTIPAARIALQRAEARLRYNLRVVELWDKTHSDRARFLLTMGLQQAASTHASMVFDEALRHELLRQTFMDTANDDGAAERVAIAAELDRTVLL